MMNNRREKQMEGRGERKSVTERRQSLEQEKNMGEVGSERHGKNGSNYERFNNNKFLTTIMQRKKIDITGPNYG